MTHGRTSDDTHDQRIVLEAEEWVVAVQTISRKRYVPTAFAERSHDGLNATNELVSQS